MSPTRIASTLFAPILAGASLRDRIVACMGALLGIAGVAAAVAWLPQAARDLPLIAAPVGASAVLVFAVPASPLAQPWPVVGGNILSALVGVAVARLVPDVALAAGLAVAAAILVMSLARCLHPPGGAVALTAVVGGPAVASAGALFAVAPVGINSALLVLAGWLFHRVSGHSYPHRAKPAAPTQDLHPSDIEQALADLGETFDVSREDLEQLLARAELHAARRRQAGRGTRRQVAPGVTSR